MRLADAGTREEFIEKNLGLAHACANRFRGRGIEYDDLFAAGCVGLVKAYDGFDDERGVQFSTYAVPVILGEVKRLFRDGGALKVSRSLKELSMKVSATRERLSKTLGEEPTVAQVAAELDVSAEQVAWAQGAALPPLSLTPAGEGDTGEFEIPVFSYEERLADTLSLQAALSALPEEDRKLIMLRFFGNRTQAQVASALGTTQVQISRRERKILLKMREKLTG